MTQPYTDADVNLARDAFWTTLNEAAVGINPEEETA